MVYICSGVPADLCGSQHNPRSKLSETNTKTTVNIKKTLSVDDQAILLGIRKEQFNLELHDQLS